MPLVARKEGSGDIVNTGHAVCVSPGKIKTLSGSGDVFVVNHGVHRESDTNEPHTHCPPVYSTVVVTFSPDVYANNLRVARLGDKYSCNAFVESIAQGTVFANG